MQKDSSNVYASGYKCFDGGIRGEVQSKKIRDKVDMFSLQSERASASSFARQKEMIELKLKQTELRLQLEIAKAEVERIRKEAELRRLKRDIELEKKRTELRMELLKSKATSSGSSRVKREEHLHRESLIDHDPDEPSCGTNFISLPVDSAVMSTNETITDCAYVNSCSSAITQQAVASTVHGLNSKPILSVGAKDAISQQSVIIQDDEPLTR